MSTLRGLCESAGLSADSTAALCDAAVAAGAARGGDTRLYVPGAPVPGEAELAAALADIEDGYIPVGRDVETYAYLKGARREARAAGEPHSADLALAVFLEGAAGATADPRALAALRAALRLFVP